MAQDRILKNYIHALLIKERIPLYKRNNIGIEDFTLLTEWINVRGTAKEKDLMEMISAEALTAEEFNLGLKKLKQNEFQKISNDVNDIYWLQEFNEIFEFYIEKLNEGKESSLHNSEKLDLSVSLAPFILWANERLNLVKVGLSNITISKRAVLSLLDKLSQCLISFSIKTLVWELHLFQENKGESRSEVDKKEDNEFNEFLRHTFVNLDNFIAFYEKYPVLVRRITIKCNQVINHYSEMLVRLDENYKEIYKVLGLTGIGDITGIDCDQGDTHQQGRFVIRLEIGGNRILYKPRDLRIQQRFYELIDYYNKTSDLLHLDVNMAFYREDYTFEKFVENIPCISEFEVKSYYKRFGQICAIVYLLNGTDIHYENIIASGEFPVIIDIETLFQHQNYVHFDNNAFFDAYKECVHSVAGTALIPILAFSKSKDRKGIDISALNGDEQVFPDKMLTVVDVNTNRMRFAYETVTLHGAKNIPIMNGEKIKFVNYINDIISGFEQTMQFTLRHKMEILNPHSGILKIFKGESVRHLLKATQNYAKMMVFSSHPNYTIDSVKLERMLCNVWAYNYRDRRCIKYELQDMIGGDIPIFFGQTDSRDLIVSTGEVIKDYFPLSSYETTQNLIFNLSKKAIEKQVAHIKVTLGMYENLNKERYCSNIAQMDVTFKPVKSDDYLKYAVEIAERILNAAIINEETQTAEWNNVVYDNINRVWKLAPLNIGLFNGISGVLLFLQAINRYVKDEKYTETISQILMTVSYLADTVTELSLDDGICSIIYPLSIAYKTMNDEKIGKIIYKQSKKIHKNLASLTECGLIKGQAGILKIMLNMYNINHDKLYLKIANDCARIIATTAIDMEDLSFAQGISGILFALDEYLSLVEDNQVLEKYNQLSQHYSKSMRKGNHLTWEQGVGRLILGTNIQKEMIVKIHNILSQITNENLPEDTLKNGKMGVLGTILEYIQKYPDMKIENEISGIISNMLSQKDLNFPTIEGYTSVGMFDGISGIGYMLLRFYDPSHVSDVLQLQI